MPSSLQLPPADIFGEVRIYSAGLAIVQFVLTLVFCGCDLAAPGGAVRLSFGIDDAGDGGEGYGVCCLYLDGSFQYLVLEGKWKGAEVDDIAISYIYRIAELYGLEVKVKIAK